MGWWPFSQTPKDERVEALKGQIYKEVYVLVTAICGISFLYKHLYLGLGLKTVITEVVILIVSAVYATVRGITLGIVSDEAEMHDRASRWPLEKKATITGLLAGLILSLAIGIRSAVVYGDEATRLKYFLIVFIASYLIYVPFLAIVGFLGTYLPRRLSERVSDKNRE